MLIHLSTFAGKPLISIDPEAGPIPLIESIPSALGEGTTFRLSFPKDDDWRDADWHHGGSTQRADTPQAAQAEPAGHVTSGKGRIWRYGAMTAAFGSMLIVGMVAATLLHTGAGSGIGSVPASFRVDPSTPSPLAIPTPPVDTDLLPHEAAGPPYEIRMATPQPPADIPRPPSPLSAPSDSSASSPPPSQPAPMPVNPAALFGLHS